METSTVLWLGVPTFFMTLLFWYLFRRARRSDAIYRAVMQLDRFLCDKPRRKFVCIPADHWLVVQNRNGHKLTRIVPVAPHFGTEVRSYLLVKPDGEKESFVAYPRTLELLFGQLAEIFK